MRLKRKLEMRFFKAETIGKVIKAKMNNATLTILGCESEFTKLDNCLNVFGGTMSLST